MKSLDLREGDDKYAFMERMVTDPAVTHVLVFCDKAYAEKANTRKPGGVATESQILSKEVYQKVTQSKFVPVVCEFSDSGEPTLPVFFASRMIRLLFDKPLYPKPTTGNAPAYITDESTAPISPMTAKFATFRQAILQAKPNLNLYRREFIDSCIAYDDSLRVRKVPDGDTFSQKILADCGKLVPVRDVIVAWVLLESEAAPSAAFYEALQNTLERICDLKERPQELTMFNTSWFEAHVIFVYETFLYIVAALLRTKSFRDLHLIFTGRYLVVPASGGSRELCDFSVFTGHAELVQQALSTTQRYNSAAAEGMHRQSQRNDLPLDAIMQAELLTLLMGFISKSVYWYPQLLHYKQFGTSFPFFIRAAEHRGFEALATITGVALADRLREMVKEGQIRMHVSAWSTFMFRSNFWAAMNMDALDTLN